MANPAPDLESLYRQADYVVDDAGVKFTIRLDGDDNADLQALLHGRNAATWAFLTAFNPNSLPATAEENAAAQAALIRIIEERGYGYLHGYGTGEDWDPEASLFILDIPRNEALKLGRQFHQSAILWSEIGWEPNLVWCN